MSHAECTSHLKIYWGAAEYTPSDRHGTIKMIGVHLLKIQYCENQNGSWWVKEKVLTEKIIIITSVSFYRDPMGHFLFISAVFGCVGSGSCIYFTLCVNSFYSNCQFRNRVAIKLM